MMQPQAADSLRDRLAAAHAAIEGLKASIEVRRVKLANGGLSSVLAERPVPLRPLGPAPRQLSVLDGHFNKVYSVDWAGDGQRLVSASQDAKLLIWNAVTHRRLQAVSLKSAWVMSCAFERRENELVASGGLDNTCTLSAVGATDGAPPVGELQGHDGYVSCMQFAGGHDRLMTGSGDSTCILWDIARASRVQSFKDHGGDVMSLSLHPSNSAVFVSGSCDATAKLWDVRSGKCAQTFAGHEGDLNAVMFMGSGLAFGTGSDDSSVKIFDLRACACINEMRNEEVMCGVTALDFSASGRLVFAGYDNANCFAWDVLVEATPTPFFSLPGHSSRISCLGVSSSGHAVATGSWDRNIIVWG